MRKFMSLMAIVVLGTFGFAGVAMAQAGTNLLENPGAEDGITGWIISGGTISASTSRVQGVGEAFPRSGSKFFDFHYAPSDSFMAMRQDVDVTGLAGLRFVGLGWIQTAANPVSGPVEIQDHGEIVVTFFDAGNNQMGTSFVEGPIGNPVFPVGSSDDWGKFMVSGIIPAGAVTARYELKGFLVVGGVINVFYDDLSFVTCITPPSGMVSWWPGDTDASDIQNGNDGILINGASAGATGKVDGAFSFDGVDDHVKVLDSNSLDTGTQFTIDAWFNTDDVDKIDPIRKTRTQAIVMYGFDNIDGKNNPLHIRKGKLYFSVRGTGVGFDDLVGVTPIYSNTWYHAAVTYDGTTAKLYLDGALEDSTATTMNMSANSGVLIGRYRNPLQSLNLHHFVGLIDEVEIFDRGLSASEIQAIYNAGSAGKCKGEVGVEVTINIKPGSDPNSINLCSGGTIPVVIFGSATFDVSTIDVASLELASATVKTLGKKSIRWLSSIVDVGSPDPAAIDSLGAPDDYPDLICHFLTSELLSDLDETSRTMELKIIGCENPSVGCTDGDPGYYVIIATDSVKIVKDCNKP